LKRISVRKLNGDVHEHFRTEKAKALGIIRGMVLRDRYLNRLGIYIARSQKEYFKGKSDAPVFLPMEEVARELGISESTLNRVVTGKYVHTPRGTMKLRILLSSSNKNEVKDLIKNLIKNEDPSKPLGDDKIALELSRMGHSIARRTVVKYREEMNIPSSRKRRLSPP
jgi:RNA polymerase sigma-54 factor